MGASLLGVAVLAFATPALAASPDPSPGAGYSPDPYPARAVTPPRVPATPAPAAAPSHLVVVPRTTTVVVHTTPKATSKPRPAKASRPAEKKVAPVHQTATAPAARRVDDHRAARFFALTAPTIATERTVSPILAAALGLFVLLNALFLVGATRVVQQR
jgi:hypothetical protein